MTDDDWAPPKDDYDRRASEGVQGRCGTVRAVWKEVWGSFGARGDAGWMTLYRRSGGGSG